MSGLSAVQEARARREARSARSKTAGSGRQAPLHGVGVDSLTNAAFFAAVLPPQGQYCVVLLPEGRHEWTDSLAGVEALAERYKDRKGVYFATAAFKSSSGRKQDNVQALKAHRLDLDAGEKKYVRNPSGTYSTQEDARRDLKRFTEETGLVPSVVVSSGEGLHVYYVLNESCAPSEWQPAAELLKRVCAAHGLRADPAVTADSARVLRPPGSLHTNGKRVTVLEASGVVYSLAEFAEHVGAGQESPASMDRPARVYDTSINADVLGQHDATPADFELIRAECDAVRWAADPANQPKVTEPYWRGVLGIVKHCAGAEGLAHEVSKHHPDYNPSDTARKLDAWGAGPTTCEYFAALNSGACAACKHTRGGAA